MSKFKVPPVSTLLGSTTSNFIRIIRGGRVDPRYYHVVLFSFLITLIGAPFRLWDRFRDKSDQLEEETPVFILGHWRSGTTFLHNLLCQDPRMGYITTYQSLFPHNMHSKWLFKSFVRWKIPKKRPTDNVDLGADLPQEDDFAMANIIPAFYCFFFFPDQYQSYYNRHVSFKEGESYDKDWARAYKKLILKARENTNGERMVLKNPANTARIPQLLEQFPKAKFIHIYRNPVMVYLSTKKFFLTLFPTLQLQTAGDQQIIDLIFELYRKIMTAYLDQHESIPKENLFEMSFEDFEIDPLDNAALIYEKLQLGNWTDTKPHLKKYLEELGDYKKNKYKISKLELDRILAEWGFVFEKFGYEVPTYLEVTQ